MPADMPPASGEWTISELKAALEHTAQVDPQAATPVDPRTLARLVGAADCRALVQALREETHAGFAEVRHENAATRELIQAVNARLDRIDDLPAKFADAAFAQANQEREDRRQASENRAKLWRYVIDRFFDSTDKVAGSKLFPVLLGVAMCAGSAGLCLSGLDFSIGDYVNFSASTSKEERALPAPNGPVPGMDP